MNDDTVAVEPRAFESAARVCDADGSKADVAALYAALTTPPQPLPLWWFAIATACVFLLAVGWLAW